MPRTRRSTTPTARTDGRMKTVNAREIAGSLRVFTAERAPIGVTLGLALGLCAGPWAMAGGDGAALLRSVAVVFLVLVVLRIADDAGSLAHDRVAPPPGEPRPCAPRAVLRRLLRPRPADPRRSEAGAGERRIPHDTRLRRPRWGRRPLARCSDSGSVLLSLRRRSRLRARRSRGG